MCDNEDPKNNPLTYLGIAVIAILYLWFVLYLS